MFEKKKVFIIECKTGCSCCHNENHYRGFYKTKEDALQRINSFKTPNSKFWPVASQYSRRGNYRVIETEAEFLPDGRVIVLDQIINNLIFVDLNEKDLENLEVLCDFKHIY